MPKSEPLTREECAKIFKYLEETEHGKQIIQNQLNATQQRHEDRVSTKGKCPNRVRKPPPTKPDEKLDKFKVEIFYHYMQPKSSSRKIKEAMKNVPGFELLNKK